MDQSILLSNRDTLLIALPFVLTLLFSIFGLDQIAAAPRVPLSRRRPIGGIDESGEPILRDPDGRLSDMRRVRRRPHAAR
jgi:hypothetical protein